MKNTDVVIEEIGGIVMNEFFMPPLNDEEGSVVVPRSAELEVQPTSINPSTPEGERPPWI